MLDFAIKMEQDARAFYLDGSRAAQDPAAQKILALLAEDEQRHEQILRHLQTQKTAYVAGDAFARIRNVYAELRDSPRALFNQADQLAAVLRRAVEIEHKGRL